MPKVCFTSNLQRHLDCPDQDVDAPTVAAALEIIFTNFPKLRGYIVDEQGALRTHMAVLVNGVAIRDRKGLDVAIFPNDEIYVVQALSGG